MPSVLHVFSVLVDNLARHAYVSRLIPQFPSYTFPNHYSIVTGLYPESHGIVSNAFYDPSSERYFYFSDSSSTMHSNFWNAEPIWSTNQDQGGKSVVLHYPGSDVEIQGKRPFKFEPFAELPSFNRTKKMIQWLDDNPDANLAILYYDDVDHAGHVHGPDSDQVNRALQEVDAAIGDLIFKLKQRNCFDDYNIVIVSDHGMTRASNARRITLDRLIPNLNSMVAWSDFGPVASFIPKSGQEQRLGKVLKRAIRKHHLPVRMYTKETMPSAYQYSKNDRIPPFVLESKAGWSIDSSEVSWHPKGQHGYGRGVRDMDGIFIGSGEAFRKNAIPTFPFHSNLDVYPLMCQLLGIEPKPNNGTMQLSMKAIGTADLQATE